MQEENRKSLTSAAGRGNGVGREAIYQLGEFTLEPELGRVTSQSTEAHLMPRTMDILVYLLENAPRVVSADELLEVFWPGRIVDTSTIHRRISQIRNVLGDDAADPTFIATVPKRGYRVVGEVGRDLLPSKARVREPVKPVEDATRAPGLSMDVPFIGREEVLGGLESRLQNARAGSASVVILSGAPGIGKTRCAREFLGSAKQHGVEAYSAWCDELVAGAPYWPWISITRAIADADRATLLYPKHGHHLAALCEFVPELARRFADLPVLPELDANEHRVRLCAAVAALLHQLTADNPLLLFIDDLHSADRASLTMLEFIARSGVDDRLVILGTARDSKAGRQHPLSKTLATLTRCCEFERVTIDGLSGPELNRLIACVSDEPERIADVIAEKTDGNPLYATLLARALSGDRYNEGMPVSLREVIVGSFAGLSNSCWRVVSIAAVIGLEFIPDMARAIADVGNDSLDASVFKAHRAGVFTESGHFSHALVQEAVYEEIPLTERRELHLAIAQQLAGQPTELIDVASIVRLARHYALGDQPVEAARWYQQANFKLVGSHDHQAYECSVLALAALAKHLATEPTQRLARWFVYSTIGAIHCAGVAQIPDAEVKGRFRRAREIAEQLKDREQQLSLLMTVYSDYLAIAENADEALQRAREASVVAKNCGDEGTRLHASITLIGRYENLNRHNEAFDVAMREIDNPPDDPLASIGGRSWHPYPRILTAAAKCRAARGYPTDGLNRVQKALDLLRVDSQHIAPEDVDVRIDGDSYLGAVQPLLECIYAAATCYFYLGDTERLGKCAAHYRDWVRDHHALFRPDAYLLTARHLCLEQRWEELADMKNQAPDDFSGHKVDPNIVALRALALAVLGNQAESEQLLNSLLATDATHDPQTLIGAARALLCTGSNQALNTAVALVADIAESIEQAGSEVDRPFMIEVQAQIARVTGDELDCQRKQHDARELWLTMGATAHIERMVLELNSLSVRLDGERLSHR